MEYGQLLAGAVVGALASLLLTLLYSKLEGKIEARRVRRFRQRREQRDEGGLLTKNVLRHYSDTDRANELYLARNLVGTPSIPMLHDESWDFMQPITPESSNGITIESYDPYNHPVNEELVKLLRQSGVRLWNGDISFLLSGKISEGAPDLLIGNAKYHGYASLVEHVVTELETIGSRWAIGRRRRKPLLNGGLSEANRALSRPVEPLILACSATVLLTAGRSTRLLLQKRSDEVMSLPGMHAVVPTYGVELHESQHARSHRGILFYNFAREFGEEIYGLERVLRMDEVPKFNPDWMFDELQSIKQLEDDVREGILSIRWTGLGVNPRDAICHLPILAEYAIAEAELKRRMARNFETKNFVFVDLHSTDFDDLVEKGKLTTATVHSVDRALSVRAAER